VFPVAAWLRCGTWFTTVVDRKHGRFPMAMYEFVCEDCEKTFTVAERISEHEGHEHPKCPKCGSKKTHQLFTAFFAKTSRKS
jgi:putative FmdB family regulatory protein